MQTHQYFSFLIYLCILLLFVNNSIIPNVLTQESEMIFLSNKNIIILLSISFLLYTLTFKKPITLDRRTKLEEHILIKNQQINENNKKNNKQPTYDFTFDGCSGGMSALYDLFASNLSWEDGCLLHDYAYWQGGTVEEKKKADDELYRHIIEKGYSKKYALAMWTFVKIGGQPFLPFPWRWGYGYPYPQKLFYEKK